MFDYFLLFLISLLLFFWWDTITKREIAIHHGKLLAKKFNLQLLDESVHCNKITFVRTRNDWLSIRRVYMFSVSTNTEDRLNCQLTLIGKSLTDWFVPPYPQKN
ncbi:MAG: DUF3301 domain-containing protein [Methylophilaceae bacterium]|jgi:hypothetical protein|nr:DUF3301 domain-containing protein [Methylophilaceae bacterium]